MPGSICGPYRPKDLVVRASVGEAQLMGAIRDVGRLVDPSQPVSNVRALADAALDQARTRRAQERILSALALLAPLLSGVGIHGVLAYAVAQRDRETGVQLALGANAASVARMVMGDGVHRALAGALRGVLVAYLAARITPRMTVPGE